MGSIYTKSELNKINRNNSFEYRLARNIACKYGEVHAVAWTSENEQGKPIAVGVSATSFLESEEMELKSFIHHYMNVINVPISFAKCYENLPIKLWS